MPQQWGCPAPARMKQHADPAWMLVLSSMPLTLRTLLTRLTVGDPSFIDHLPFLSALLEEERIPCGATHGSIWLEGKVLARIPSGFPRASDDGRFVALDWRLSSLRLVKSRRELGAAYRLRLQVMAEFQPQVPHPLRHHLPALLSPGRMTAPPVGVLFPVLICQYRLKGSTMQGQLDDITGGKRVLRQVRKEQFVHHARTRDPDSFLLPVLPLLVCPMRCHYHAARSPLGSHWHVWAIVEEASRLTFRALVHLIGRQVHTRLNQWVIQHGVLFATGHKREASQVSDHSSQAILAEKRGAGHRPVEAGVQ